MRVEFEERLSAAERRVYALTKERDALRRGTEKLTSANELLKVSVGVKVLFLSFFPIVELHIA